MNKLKKQAFLGVLWKSGNLIFNQIIALVIKLVLVRLLIPDEFGLAAMAAVVISSVGLIGGFGVGTAFIRDNESDTKRARNTLFYLMSGAHILIALVGFLIAPLVAGFFSYRMSSPDATLTLIWIIRVLALTHLVHIFVFVPNHILIRKLRFKEGVVAGAVGTITYGIFAVVLAFLGFGVWSIIIAQVANHITHHIVIFAYSPFIPSLIFDKQIAKKYLNFGKNSFFASLFGIIIENGDDTIIGRMLGAAALGFYSISQNFAGMLVSVVSGVINGIMFPVFSRIQGDKELYAKAFFKTFRLTNMLTIPAIGGAVVLAREIVFLAFGEKWLPILIPFYILAFATFLNNLVGIAGPVLNSLNKPQILRNNRLIQLGFFVVLIYPFTKFWGLAGTAWVMVIFSLISVIHYTPVLAKEIEGFYKNMIMILMKVLPITLIMMGIVYFLKKMVPVNFFWLFSLVFIGIVVYFVPMWFIDKDLKWDVQEAWSVFREKLGFFRR